MYDGASALAEAGLLAVNQKKRNKLVISSTVNPAHREVVKTYIQGGDVELVIAPQIDGVTDLKTLSDLVDSDTAGLLLQTPNFFGCIEDAGEMAKIAHTFVNQAGISIENFRLLTSALENERYQEELKIAKKVQKSLQWTRRMQPSKSALS